MLFKASGFHINYLAKVPEVKDTVHKHSLLHHLCVTINELYTDSTDLYSEISAIARCSKVSEIYLLVGILISEKMGIIKYFLEEIYIHIFYDSQIVLPSYDQR